MKNVLAWFRRETVFTVSLAAAVLSFLLTPPSADTLRAVDAGTLCMLFSLMTVVAGLRLLGLFDRLSAALARRVSSLRALSLVLVGCCFFLSMAATNDVALLTLVPFTLLMMASAPPSALMLTVALETIAANLGSMVTPIGNPQNLYLYTSGALGMADFPRLTWPYALLSLVTLSALTLLVPRTRLDVRTAKTRPVPPSMAALYALMGLTAVLGVCKLIPAWATAAVILSLALLFDRPVLRRVDYTLLGTFVCFFVFVSGIKGCAAVRAWLEGLMAAQPLLTALLSSQVISNVPACLLLAPFTQDAARLMLGVNLGGLGTLVASLASLISFKLYAACPGARKGRYFGLFTLLNALMLAALLALCALMGQM